MSITLHSTWRLATSWSRRAHVQRLRLAGLALGLYMLKGLAVRALRPDQPRVVFNTADERMARILRRMTVIKEDFRPTLWAQGAYLQLVALVLWNSYHAKSVSFTRHVVTCADGQDVALDEYATPKGCEDLPKTAPLALIIHTISGTTPDEVELAQLCFSRGWRPMFLSRRAHCGPLTVPKYNVMGCPDDTKEMIDRAVSLYPEASFVGACGFSAGSGGIVNYVGQQPAGGPVQAAVVGSPGYDISTTFDAADKTSPLLAQYLLKRLKNHFLEAHEEVLSTSEHYEHVASSTTLQEFVSRSAPMAGCESFDDYLKRYNPMENMAGNLVPALVLSAQDDPVCVKEMIPFGLFEKMEHAALVCTRQGSHVAFREGAFGESSYMHRLALDFLDAARLDAEEQANKSN